MGVRRGGGGGPTPGPRFPPSPPPPAEARPGLGGGRAGLINQGLVVDAGRGRCHPGREAGHGGGACGVFAPASSPTNWSQASAAEGGPGAGGRSRCGAAGRTPAAGVGARRRAVPAVGGRRAARACLRASLPRALGRWQLRAFSPAARRCSRGAPEPPHPPRAPAPAPGRGLFPGRHQSHSLVRFPGSGSRLFWM